MIASYWPIRCSNNADFAQPFTFESTPGTPTDVTSWVSSMQVYDEIGGTLLLDVAASGSLVNGGVAGTITPTVLEAIMSTLAPGLYTYDYRALSSGLLVRWLHGPFILEAGVTVP